MAPSESDYQRYKDEVCLQTQGNVDLNRDHPNLGRYLHRPNSEDLQLEEAIKSNFTENEKKRANGMLPDLFRPDMVLFADKSRESASIFTYLLCSPHSFRALPTDEYFPRPTLGVIIFDFIAIGEKRAKRLIGSQTKFGEKMGEILRKAPIPLPEIVDTEWEVIMKKVRMIQNSWAIQDMVAILNAK